MRHTYCVALVVLLVASLVGGVAHGNGVSRVASNAWVTDGYVVDVASRDDTVYLAGSFTRIGPKTGPFTIIDRVTGQPDLTVPRVTGGEVFDIDPDGSGGYIIAGSFTAVGGVPRRGLARLTSAGALDVGFSPALDIIHVTLVTVSAGRVFAAVERRTSSELLRSLVALDLSSGQQLAWTPAVAPSSVRNLETGPNGSVLVTAHPATGGVARTHRFDGSTGAVLWTLDAWALVIVDGGVGYAVTGYFGNPGAVVQVNLQTGAATQLATMTYCSGCRGPQVPLSAALVWLSGSFSAVNGQPRAFAAAFDFGGNLTPWTPAPPPPGPTGLRATVFEDRLYTSLGYVLDAQSGERIDWAPAIEVRSVDCCWRAIPNRGVVRHGGDGAGFAFFPRVESPPPVTGLAGTADGNRLTLSWQPIAGAISYILEAGSAPSLADLAVIDLGSEAPNFSVDGPSGSFYVRVRAKNDGGIGPPSSALRVVLGRGACAASPGAPVAFTGSVSGNVVSLQWSPPTSGLAPMRYILDASTSSGGTPFAQIDTGLTRSISGAVPPGTYFVRVRAENACGSSAPTDEVRIPVP